MKRTIVRIRYLIFLAVLTLLAFILSACGDKGYLRDHPEGCTSEAAYKAGYYDGKHGIGYRSNYGDDCKREYGDLQDSYRTGYNDGQAKRSQGGLFRRSSDDSRLSGASRSKEGLFHHKSRGGVSVEQYKNSATNVDKASAKEKASSYRDN